VIREDSAQRRAGWAVHFLMALQASGAYRFVVGFSRNEGVLTTALSDPSFNAF
jgi:hypothetical protein